MAMRFGLLGAVFSSCILLVTGAAAYDKEPEITVYEHGTLKDKPTIFRMHSLSVTVQNRFSVCSRAKNSAPTLNLNFAENPGPAVYTDEFLRQIGRKLNSEFVRLCKIDRGNFQGKFQLRVQYPGRSLPAVPATIVPRGKAAWSETNAIEDEITYAAEIVNSIVEQREPTREALLGEMRHEDNFIAGAFMTVGQSNSEAIQFTANGKPCDFDPQGMLFAAGQGSTYAQHTAGRCYLNKVAPRGVAGAGYLSSFSDTIASLAFLVSAYEAGYQPTKLFLNVDPPFKGSFPGLDVVYGRRSAYYKDSLPIRTAAFSDPYFIQPVMKSLNSGVRAKIEEQIRDEVVKNLYAGLKDYCVNNKRNGRFGTRWNGRVCGVTVDGAALSYYDLAYVNITGCADDYSSCSYRYQIKCYADNLGGRKWCQDQAPQTGRIKLSQ